MGDVADVKVVKLVYHTAQSRLILAVEANDDKKEKCTD